MALGRRAFGQRLGLTLAALGIADSGLAGWGRAYQRALALPAKRRLALLVGIDRYPEALYGGGTSRRVPPLRGCAMDVQLQRSLLIHHFGFAPGDVVTLINGEATRQGILQAIDEHLVAQAQGGDAVVFHFSGLGGQGMLGDQADVPLPCLVAVDSPPPGGQGAVTWDLLEAVVAARLQRLKTEHITTVLDVSTGAVPYGVGGNLRGRSRPGIPTLTLPPEISPPADLELWQAPQWPGLLLRASAPGAPAIEGDWPGFSAGLFTYALTERSWGAPSQQRSPQLWQGVKVTVAHWGGAKMKLQSMGAWTPVAPGRLYDSRCDHPTPVVGVLQAMEGQEGSVWLGGLSPSLLAHGELGARLRPALPLGAATPPVGEWVVKSRRGLVATVHPQGNPDPGIGTGLVEVTRRLAATVPLKVALDGTLERIERVDATSALAGLPYVTTAIAGEQMADCVFGRVQPSILAGTLMPVERPGETTAAKGEITQGGYGLFSPDRTLIAGTTTDQEEAVKTAIGRLIPHLQSILAAKLLRLTQNPVSSALPVRFTLETTAKGKGILTQVETVATQGKDGGRAPGVVDALADMGADGGRRRCFRLYNLSDRPLYGFLAAYDQQGRFSVYCPPLADPAVPDEPLETLVTATLIPAQDSRRFPEGEMGWLFKHPPGTLELWAILCTAPLTLTWTALRQQGMALQGDRLVVVPSPLAVAQALVEDLGRAAAEAEDLAEDGAKILTLHTAHWAALTITS